MKIKIPLKFQKLYRWEFWPESIFYIPIYCHFLVLALKSKKLTFFSAVNPGMYAGGLVGDSKYETLEKIPEKYLPKTIFVKKGTKIPEILEAMKVQKIKYPLIAKPDVGARGKGVEKIVSELDLKKYLDGYSEDLIIQDFINLELEFGVFYVRFPNQESGQVTSLMQRDFLQVFGNGMSSLRDLILDHERAFFYKETLFDRYENDLDIVLMEEEMKTLESIGNHSRGTKFLNICNQISPKLEKNFDELSKQIPGFFYGRYDVKADSLKDLEKGNFQIIELNGANSEPAHVYDPNMKLFNAYKDYFHHWNMLQKISSFNRKHGVICTPYKEVVRLLRNR